MVAIQVYVFCLVLGVACLDALLSGAGDPLYVAGLAPGLFCLCYVLFRLTGVVSVPVYRTRSILMGGTCPKTADDEYDVGMMPWVDSGKDTAKIAVLTERHRRPTRGDVR